MPPAPISLSRRLAVLAGVLVLTVGTIGSASAASPHAFKPRDGGDAWDTAGTMQTDRVIVTFKKGTTGAERAEAAKALGLTNGRGIRGAGAGSYRLSPGVARTALPASVASITPDLRMSRDLDPTDEPGWDLLWGLHNVGQVIDDAGTANIDIDGLEAYSITQGDPAVVVAVIDDGVDFDHPDLAARAWTNPGESGDGKETNGEDDDENGYIDDVHGWDFCNDDNSVHDFDEDFHGTHVAGTIAASLDGQGVVGVAPNVRIMALKFIDPAQPSCGLTSLAMQAIAYAKSFGVVISNNSYGLRVPRSQAKVALAPFATAIANSGMLFVTSAGNDGIDNDTDSLPAFPASFDLPNVITVAAVDHNGGLAEFSNYGKTTVDVAAPGVNIISSVPIDADHPDPAEQWAWLSGTSMASPHVAGVAALLASQDPAFRVSAGVTALRAKLLAATKAVPLTVGDTVTGRMVDARFVLDTVAPTALAPNSHAFSVGSVLGTSTISTIVGWPAGTDDSSGIRNYTLEQQVNGGGWTTAISGTTGRTAARPLTFNTSNVFRVKAMDRAGNLSGVVTGPAVRPVLYQETTSLATYTGTWTSASSTAASAGRLRYATRAGASVSFRFTGRAIAVVAPKGSTRGSVKVYVDGAYAGAISLYRSASVSRVIVFGKSWTASGTHTIKLVVVGTAGRPRVDIDGFAILR